MIEFSPYSIEFATDPYPTYKWLRDEAPVFRHEDLDFWAISRYADVVQAHFDPQTYSSAEGPTIERMQDIGFLIMKDPPGHQAHKMLVTKVFTPQRMMAMERFIRKECVRLLEKAAEKEEFDFVKDFSVDLPLTVISEMIGIPEELRHDVHEFANMLLDRDTVDMAAMGRAAMTAHHTYMELIRLRRGNPRDDVISLLMNTEIEDGDGVVRHLTDEELASRMSELAAAGHETVAKAIPNGAMAFQKFPSEWRKLIADPSLINGAVEEILRYDPPSQLQGRTTTRDVELHGVTIPAGSRTMLLTGAAARDERKYADPDTFDITRAPDKVSPYFGYGIHRCLGINLARLEIRVAFEELSARYPDFEVFTDRATRKILSNVRGVASLPCRPGPGGSGISKGPSV